MNRRREWSVLAAIWCAYALLVRRFWFLTEDAFISFRYARNWAEGNGVRFNLGDQAPVEGYTNFLWVAVCAGLERLGASMVVWAPRISFLLGSLLLLCFYRAARRSLGLGPGVSALGTAWLALQPPVTVWSTSGLETIAFTLAFFVAFERMVLRPGAPAPWSGAACGLAGALLRGQGILWAVAIGFAAVVSRGMKREPWRRPVLVYFGALLASFAVYYAWRYAYYGLPYPNTAYAKVGVSGLIVARGLSYVGLYFLTLVTPALALLAVPVALGRELRPVGLPVVLVVVGFLGYAVIVGGDFMCMGRILVDAAPFEALLLTWGLDRVRARSDGWWAPGGLAAATILLGLLPSWDRHLVPESVRERLHFRYNTSAFQSEYRQWDTQRKVSEMYGEIGRALKEYAQPGDSLVTAVIGNLGYYSGLTIYDQYGLVDHDVAIRPVDPSEPKSPGHDKLVPKRYFLDRRPTYWAVQLYRGEGIGRMVESWARKQRPFGLEHGYVVDFMVLAGGEWAGEEKAVLAVLRTVEEGSPEAAWEAFDRKVRSLR